MIRYLYGHELAALLDLEDSMFRDRKTQFFDRLKWDVSADARGWERDEYDGIDPVYVVLEDRNGLHQGSMRFLPTTGDTMVNDHFSHLADGVRIVSPFIWECTRFCLAPDAPRQTSAKLMLGGLELGLRFGLSHAVGVFDARMVRIYQTLGWSPTILGTSHGISVGLWVFGSGIRRTLLNRAGLSSEISNHWMARSFGTRRQIAA